MQARSRQVLVKTTPEVLARLDEERTKEARSRSQYVHLLLERALLAHDGPRDGSNGSKAESNVGE